MALHKNPVNNCNITYIVSISFLLLTFNTPFTPKAGAVNIQSRPQSHSSGEFSLLHEHEAWSSSSSSPIQYLKRQTRSSPVLQHKMPETLESRAHHKIKTGSPGSEVVTLQQFLEESNKLTSIQVSFIGDLNLNGHYKLNFCD